MASRSLGVLTLDLIARVGGFEKGMDSAARLSKKRMGEIRKEIKMAGTVIAGFAAGAGASLVLLTQDTLQLSNEVVRLSQVSNTGYKDFQRYAAGAKFLGVEQDKLADIFKDTGDKVGDFLETGGGPLVDFFDNIAPKAGITAKQFRDLSGPQALELYVKGLEAANLSQSQMTFYMEAIASDATQLLPLLRNNAEGFRLFGDQAEKAGAILSDDTLQAAQELEATLYLLEQSSQGFKNQVSQATLPVLQSLAEEFSNVTETGLLAEQVGSTLAGVMKGLAATAVGAFAAVQLLGKGIATLAAAGNTAFEDAAWYEKVIPVLAAKRISDRFSEVKGTFDMGAEDLRGDLEEYARLLDGIWSGGSGGSGSNERIEEIKRFLEQRDALLSGAGSVAGGEGSAGAAAALEEQQKALDKLIDSASAYTKQWRSARDADSAALDQVAKSLMTEEELILSSYEKRKDEILAKTEETSFERRELLARLEQQTNDQLAEINQGFWANWLDAAEESLTSLNDLADSTISTFSQGVGSAFESMIFDAQTAREAFQQLGEGMARSIVRALGEMAAQWLAYQAVQLLVGKTTAAAGAAAMIGQAQASSALAAINSFASTAAIPVVGPAAAPAAAAAATAATAPFVATVAAASFAGMFDEGGVIPAGKWGIAGEIGPEIVRGPAHVTSRADTAKMLGGNGVTVNVNNAPPGTSVQRRQMGGREVVDVMVADVNSDGPFFRALQSKSNVRRVGS
ncbi:hypothetical protein ACMG4M_05345 [Alcanivorax sp. IL3]|uniref:hypothetical protein n=1 Tax=unclassified Alcanivorax TaxID=2638842 RepID=UPI0039C27688